MLVSFHESISIHLSNNSNTLTHHYSFACARDMPPKPADIDDTTILQCIQSQIFPSSVRTGNRGAIDDALRADVAIAARGHLPVRIAAVIGNYHASRYDHALAAEI